MRTLFVVGFCLLQIAACKNNRVGGKDDRAEADAGALVLPRRVAEAELVSSAEFEVDDQSGKPKPFLVLRLDYFPEPEPGRTTLPACFRRFPGNFALGEARCIDGTGTAPLFAKNVDQDCYTKANSEREAAVEPLLLVGCKRAEVYAYSFDPQIRIDVETR